MIPCYSKDTDIIGRYREIWRTAKHDEYEIDDLLAERKCVLDRDFVWTDEAIGRLKAVSEKAEECLAHFKAVQSRLPKWLRDRCGDGPSDCFNDFELCYQITPIVRWIGEDGEEHEDEGIYEVLQSAMKPGVFLSIDYKSFDDSMYFKSEGKDGYRMATRGFDNDRLKGVYVNYVIHQLSSHLNWSIRDILSISEFWGETILRGQHFAEIDKSM